MTKTFKKGQLGEDKVIDRLYGMGDLLTDIRINGTQIDAILSSDKGLFCIEVKTYKREYDGYDIGNVWDNPISQNDMHVKRLGIAAFNTVICTNNIEENYNDIIFNIEGFIEYHENLPVIGEINIESIKRYCNGKMYLL